MLSTNLKKKFY